MMCGSGMVPAERKKTTMIQTETQTEKTITWEKTTKMGGPEALGEALSSCGGWRIVRMLYMCFGGKDRYHWFVERWTEFDDASEWIPVEVGGSDHYRTLTEAKEQVARHHTSD